MVRDLLLLLDTGRWLPLALGEAWRDLAPASFAGVSAWLPDPLAGAVLALWLSPLLIVPGAALLFLCRRRVRPRRLSSRPS